MQGTLCISNLPINRFLEIILEYFDEVVHLLFYSVSLKLVDSLLDLLERNQQLLALQKKIDAGDEFSDRVTDFPGALEKIR